MKIHNVIYIGAGPATVFSVLKYPIKDSLIIEKGKSLKNRDPKEVIFGFGGAGAYSDSKLVSNPTVGGDINNVCPISDVLFNQLADEILEYYTKYYNYSPDGVGRSGWLEFEWLPEDPYQIKSDKLKLLKSRVSHVGTDRSKEVFQNIEHYISTKVCPIHFEEEVTDILELETREGRFFVIKTNKERYLTKRVVIGVGKRSSLVTDFVEQHDLEFTNNLVQLGVRFEGPNDQMEELVKKFYDFKVVMQSKLGRWRTFCCNAGAAYVAVEKSPEFVSANGHSYANKENTGLINFGLMGELKLDLTREQQIELVSKINKGERKLLAQTVNGFLTRSVSKLEYKTTVPEEEYYLGNLWDYYPEEINNELADFIKELKKTFNLHGHFFGPEIKLTNPLIKMSSKFEIYPGVFVIGDCSGFSRSIVQAGIIGMVVGEELAKAIF